VVVILFIVLGAGVATFRAVGGGEISATRRHGDAVARLAVTIRIAGRPGDATRGPRNTAS
jgi:hypothetical protein